MSPIEAHLVAGLTHDLAALGIGHVQVTVLSADADNWRYVVASEGRSFEFGFNHRDRFWCRETTPGAERHLLSNDAPAVDTGDVARRLGLQLIRRALVAPGAIQRDPPII